MRIPPNNATNKLSKMPRIAIKIFLQISIKITFQETDQYWTDSRVTFSFFLCTIQQTIKAKDKKKMKKKCGEENHNNWEANLCQNTEQRGLCYGGSERERSKGGRRMERRRKWNFTEQSRTKKGPSPSPSPSPTHQKIFVHVETHDNFLINWKFWY